LNYHNITKEDMLNGEGLRVVLWVAGCNHHCKGCQNPETWDENGGIPFDKAAEDELFEALNLFDTEKRHEIDVDQFREEFKENLPNVPENEINDIIEFLKHEGRNTINIQEAVQNLSEKIKSHLN